MIFIVGSLNGGSLVVREKQKLCCLMITLASDGDITLIRKIEFPCYLWG